MPLSIDLRRRVIAAIADDIRIVKIAKIFKVSRRVIYNWIDLQKQTNNLMPKTGYQKGHSHKIMDWEQFKSFVEKHKECTIPKMIVEWKNLTNISVSPSSMSRALKKINYTSKKNF